MDVFITINTPNNGKGQVCPQCSGDALGDVGTCIGGATPGAQCVVEGTAFVADSTGNTNYKLSSACRPTGSAVATVKLPLDPFRTGTTTGGRCPGQVSDDNCAGGACNAACSGAACDTMTADPTNPEGPQVCRDRKGGISQLCCEDTTTVPCHPTRDGGQIVRTGRAVAPTPDAPGVPFPATGLAVLTSVFCEPGLNNHVLDLTTSGLPGPGALIEPMTAQWLP